MSDPNLTVSLKASPIPYGIVALAQFVNVPVAYEENTKDDLALVRNGVCVTDPAEVTGILASQGAPGGESSKANGLLAKASVLRTTTGFQDAVAIFDDLDDHLSFRTFFASHTLGVVDLAIWGAIKGSSPALGIIKRGTHVHLVRWYSHLESLPHPQQVVASVNTAKQKKSTASKSSTGFVLDLPNARMGAVVTRFPPEPSGYLHIGHAKAAMLNQYFAKAYKGKLIIRFDDTNPTNEREEFEQTIFRDLELMEISGDVISHSSDYFDLIYDYGLKIIKEGHAYADDTPAEQMKYERTEGIASKNRDRSVEENLAIFEKMKQGTEEGIRWCIRAKMSVDNPNKAMRDPVIYRCNVEHKHHRTGDKWKMYPTYDFTVPILDSTEGVTHALRANEYRDRNPQYEWFQSTLGLRPNIIWDFSRLNFNYTLLSKRKLRKFVEQGLVSGWDDPRFPTIRGLRRRGVTVEALRQYILSLGASQSILQLEWDGIWAINKKVIDPVAPRFYAVEKGNAVTVTIAGGPSPVEFKDMPRHKKNPAVGTKRTAYATTIVLDQQDAQTFGNNEEITLMDWGNAIVQKIERDADGVIHGIEMQLHLDGDFKKTDKKITWLAASADAPGLIPVTLIDFDFLITKKKIEENEDWENFITPQTEFRTDALADPNLATLERGTIVQFERKGYYILDSIRKKDDGSIAGAELFLIPDGKAATVTSKAGAKATVPAASKVSATASEGASTVSMYNMKPTYGDDIGTGESSSVGMYAVRPVYD